DWSPQQRADELAHWSQVVAEPDGVIGIYRTVLADLGHRLLEDSVQRIPMLERLTECERELWSALDALERERQAHTTAAGQRGALLASTSWRLTSPIRAAGRALQRLK